MDFQGNNDGVWVDHCKFSLVGRMFIVSHYDGSRITISNNEFDGQTTTSATCNDNHYWTMMFIADGDQISLDSNYFHDVSGRAPKLGQDGVTGTFHATNNYFSNMLGHAFDAYDGASALIEGNVFESVTTPITDQAATVSTFYNVPDSSAASACSSVIGRSCILNDVDSSSGDFPSLKSSSALSAFSKVIDYLVVPVAASSVASSVKSNAGPSNLSASTASTDSDSTTTSAAAASKTTTASSVKTSSAAKTSTTAKATSTAKASSTTSAAVKATATSGPSSQCPKGKRAFRESLRGGAPCS